MRLCRGCCAVVCASGLFVLGVSSRGREVAARLGAMVVVMMMVVIRVALLVSVELGVVGVAGGASDGGVIGVADGELAGVAVGAGANTGAGAIDRAAGVIGGTAAVGVDAGIAVCAVR